MDGLFVIDNLGNEDAGELISDNVIYKTSENIQVIDEDTDISGAAKKIEQTEEDDDDDDDDFSDYGGRFI